MTKSHPSAKKGKRLPGVSGNYVTTPKSASTMPSEPPPPKGWTRVTVDSAKNAKARVMWAHPKRMIMCRTNYAKNPEFSAYLVLPMPTLKAARARMRFEGMDREAKVEALAKAIYESQPGAGFRGASEPCPWGRFPYPDDYRTRARAVLRVIEGEAT